MQQQSRKRLQIAIVLLLALLAAAIVPSHLKMGQHKAQLAKTLSMELGRDVSIGDISFRLLPQPGFTITNGFSIADDSRFSAEPLLTAESVDADLRLASLWRGRLEIAKISLAKPSLNLVRDKEGRWNLEPLLMRASHIASASMPQKHSDLRMRFPYVEAEDGRINFKLGVVKSPYALTEADFSFYLEPDDHWNARLEAKPMRTDMPITDTGTIRIRSRLGRASTLGAMLMEGTLTLEDAQLGQVSKLLLGADQGWRGGIGADLSAQGRLDHLRLATKLSVNQFRRFDVVAADSIDLSADCSGYLNYAIERRSLEGLACTIPLGAGSLGLNGNFTAASKPEYDLTLQAHALPASQLSLIYKNASQNIAADLQMTGEAEANFNFKQTVAAPEHIAGSGEIRDLSISSSRLPGPLALPEPVRLLAEDSRKSAAKPAANGVITIMPFTVPEIGSVTGSLNSSTYQIGLKTDADVSTLAQLGQALGVSVPFRPQEGRARGKLSFTGQFAGFRRSPISGDLELANLTIGQGTRRLQIASAHLTLNDNSAQLRNLRASIAAAGLEATGDIAVARPCAVALDCQFSANLHVSQMDFAKMRTAISSEEGTLASLFNRRSWLDDNRNLLARLNVTGTLQIDHMRNRTTNIADNANTSFQFAGGKLVLTHSSAAFAGGRIASEALAADLSGRLASYSITAKLDRVGLATMLNFFGPANASGALNADIQLQMNGNDASSLMKSATGTARFSLLNGTLRQGNSNFPFRSMGGEFSIADQQLTLIKGSAIQSSGKPWQAQGIIAFALKPPGTMDLTFNRDGSSQSVTGPICAPADASTGGPGQKLASK